MGTGIGIIEGSGDGTSVGKGVGGRVYSTSTNDVERQSSQASCLSTLSG